MVCAARTTRSNGWVNTKNSPRTEHDRRNAGSYLIINADDFGYSPGINQGILEAAASGTVTATGVFANAANLADSASLLREAEGLDIGVHLSLTHGLPLTSGMRTSLQAWEGRFPNRHSLLYLLLRNRIRKPVVAQEWRAQIERCVSCGLSPVFLNSHEHVHMLPRLFSVASELATEYSIRHVRVTRGEWSGRQGFDSLFRTLVLGFLRCLTPRAYRERAPFMLGLAESGSLSLAYLEKTLASLQANRVYELMCHPGYYRNNEIDKPGLLHYHRWDHERRLLCGKHIPRLCSMYGIQLIGFRDLAIQNNRPVAAT